MPSRADQEAFAVTGGAGGSSGGPAPASGLVPVSGGGGPWSWQRLPTADVNATAANGATDGTSINAALTSLGAAGGTARLVPGKTYVLDTGIVIPSNCTLDISGATLTRGAGFTQGPMIKNQATIPQRTVTDAAITAGTNTLTSATAAFTSADIGSQVQIVGAGMAVPAGTWGGAGNICMYATILSVTNATTVTLSRSTWDSSVSNAANTVSGATCYIFRRDANIGLLGNAQTLINGGANNQPNGSPLIPTAMNQAHILIRRVDGLAVDGRMARVTASAGVSLFKVGDITNFDYRRWVSAVPTITSPGAFDLLHMNGPAKDYTIQDCYGVVNDDGVYVGVNDWLPYLDVSGDLKNGKIGNVHFTSSAHPVIVYGGNDNQGTQRIVDGLAIDGVYGAANLNMVLTQDNSAGGVGNGGAFQSRGLSIRNIEGQAGLNQSSPVAMVGLLGSGQFGDVLLENLTWPGGSGLAGMTQANQQPIVQLACTAQSITIRGVHATKDVNYVDVVQVTNGASRKLLIEDVNMAGTVVNEFGVNVLAIWGGGIQSRVTLRAVRGYFDNQQQNTLVFVPIAWPIQELVIGDFEVSNAAALVLNTGTAGLFSGISNPTISFSDGNVANVPYAANLNISATVKARAVDHVGNGNPFVRNGYTGTIRLLAGDGIYFNNVSAGITNPGGGTISQTGLIPVDISILNGKQDGDMVINNNAALSCGTGPCIYHAGGTGNGWKNLYSGATY